MKRFIIIAMSHLAFAACTSSDPTVGSANSTEQLGQVTAALTADQCVFEDFVVNGKVTVCHRTSSAKNPYVIIRTDVEGCINGHTKHAEDYVGYNDPTCAGKGCYPEGAPYDKTVPCCEGLSVVDGKCASNLCTGVECVPNVCQKEGSGECDPATGSCHFEFKEGPCDDGNDCTSNDKCRDNFECVGELHKGCGCGDGIIQNDEDCDGDKVGEGDTCESLGLGKGELRCKKESCTYDTSGCGPRLCGNGKLDDGEKCEGSETIECTKLDAGYGMAACKDCAWDTSTCQDR